MRFNKYVILSLFIAIGIFSCDKETFIEGNIKTMNVYAITSSSATSGGEVFITGQGHGIDGLSVEKMGIMLSTSKNNLENLSSADTFYIGSLNGSYSFLCSLSNLQAKTTYFIRAFVYLKSQHQNSETLYSNVLYGDIKSFTTEMSNEIIFTLSTPTNVVAKQSGNNIVISWNEVEGAKRYTIEKSSTGIVGSYQWVMWLLPTTWIDYTPFDTTNYYRVKAQDDSGGESDWGYAQSTLGTILQTPTEVSAKRTLMTHVGVTWNKVIGAEQYDIYRSNSANGNYILMGTTVSTYWEDEQPLEDNYYRIKALKGTIESEFSEYAYIDFRLTSLQPCPIQNLSVVGRSATLTIFWQYSPSEYCGTPLNYEIKKRNTITGAWNLITTTTAMNYIDTSVHPGRNWYAILATNNSSQPSESVSGISEEIPIATPTALGCGVNGNTIVLAWNIVSQATGYQIFKSSSATGTYSLIEEITINTNTWTDRYPSQGMNYYKIKAKWNPPYASPSGGVISDLSNYTSIFF